MVERVYGGYERLNVSQGCSARRGLLALVDRLDCRRRASGGVGGKSVQLDMREMKSRRDL